MGVALRRALMREYVRLLAAAAVCAPIFVVCATAPAGAISVDLAKKCRDMAIRSHPPPFPIGNKAYAEAERAFFADCVAKNGQMQSDDQHKDPNAH
jgi:hypothetical protein